MKQKIKTIAIIKDKENYLLLKNNKNQFELPQNNLAIGEQPEVSLSRKLSDLFNKTPVDVKLNDVISYLPSVDSQRTFLYIIYDIKYDNFDKVKLSNSTDKYHSVELVSRSANLAKVEALTDESRFILDIVSQSISRTPSFGDSTIEPKDYVVFTDGGSRGNPGQSAAAYVILHKGEVLESGGEFLGITDNAQAEYHGLRLGLEAANRLNLKNITVKMDNLMVVNQMNGIYKVKNRSLWPLYSKMKKLSDEFNNIDIVHVRRESNTQADNKVNEILDSNKTTT